MLEFTLEIRTEVRGHDHVEGYDIATHGADSSVTHRACGASVTGTEAWGVLTDQLIQRCRCREIASDPKADPITSMWCRDSVVFLDRFADARRAPPLPARTVPARQPQDAELPDGKQR